LKLFGALDFLALLAGPDLGDLLSARVGAPEGWTGMFVFSLLPAGRGMVG
jgi:hypothetical protein